MEEDVSCPNSEEIDKVTPGEILRHNLYRPHLVGLPSLQGILFVSVQEILYCKGESSQTSLFLTDKKRHLINRTLKECEETLDPLGFCRIHKSYLINLLHIRKYIKGEGRCIELSDGSRLEVTRGYKEKMLQRLYQL